MLRFLIAFVFIAGFVACAQADCTGTSLSELLTEDEQGFLQRKVDSTPYGEGLIWRAERQGRQILLVGTLHIPDPRLEAIAERVAPALGRPGTVLFVEAGPEEQDALSKVMLQQPDRIFLMQGPTLPEMLAPPEWRAIREAASALGIPAPLAAKMQPWYLALALSMPPCAISQLTGGGLGLDNIVIEDAQDLGVPVRALEDWDVIFSLVGEDPMDEQLDFLRLAAATPELSKQAFIALREFYFAEQNGAAWAIGHIAARRGMAPAQADAVFAEVERDFLIFRNTAWLPRILDASTQHKNLVVAVGAAHLQGRNGLIKLLAKQGWQVERQP